MALEFALVLALALALAIVFASGLALASASALAFVSELAEAYAWWALTPSAMQLEDSSLVEDGH